MKLINIGFGNLVSAGRWRLWSAPILPFGQASGQRSAGAGMLIDASYGRSTRAVSSWTRSRCPFSPSARNGGQPCAGQAEKPRASSDRRGAVRPWKMKISVCRFRCRRYRKDSGQRFAQGPPRDRKTVSATTRSPAGEQEGVDYYYRTKEQFQQLIDQDEVVEHNFFNGNYHGTLEGRGQQAAERGKLAGHGHRCAWRGQYPPHVSWCHHHLSAASSTQELERRLRGRRHRDRGYIRRRHEIARNELAQQDKFTLKLVNDEADACAARLYDVICQRAGLTR